MIFGVVICIALLWIWAILYYAVSGFPISSARPWTIIATVLEFYKEDSIMLRIGLTGVGVLVTIAVTIMLYFRDRMNNRLGGARFAKESDIKKAGLRSPAGLILGKYKGKYLMDDGQTHVLVSAPTGSGKGVGVVIPNLLNWNGLELLMIG